MRKAIGLRTEIIVNLSLLLGAALLFSGFLLITVAEEELLDQRLQSLSGTVDVVARTLLSGPEDEVASSRIIRRSELLFAALAKNFPLESWGLVDADLGPVFFDSPGGAFQFDLAELGQCKRSGLQTLQVDYTPNFFFWSDPADEYALITAPLLDGENFRGALQARFSLQQIMRRATEARNLLLLYILLFGAVVASFSVYLLSRRIVSPMRRFLAATRQLAGGHLDRQVPVDGPRELSDLAFSFNAMTAALKDSRQEAEAYTRSLETANAKLEQAHNELVRSEKMATVGHLAAGMAHEIGNPLGAAVGYLEFLKADLAPREREVAERATVELARIDTLVKDLLDYAATGSSPPEPVAISEVAAQSIELLTSQGILGAIEVRNRLPAELPRVRGSRNKLLQVFVNLFINACDVMPSGGAIRLEAEEKSDEVRIFVEDSGPGIAPEVLPHVFDPFFTTKDPGKGRGLGLAVCHRIVEECGGRIDISSAPGQGTRVSLRLKKAGEENVV